MLTTWLLLGALQATAAAEPVDDSDLAGPPAISLFSIKESVRRVQRAEPIRNARVFVPAVPGALAGAVYLTGPDGKDVPGRDMTVVLAAGERILTETRTDESGAWRLAPPPGARGAAVVRLRLENKRWSVREPSGAKPYEWEAMSVGLPLSGPVQPMTFRLGAGENGALGLIHLQFLEAFDFLAREGVSPGFWTRRLTVKVPGSGDFFLNSAFSVDLTRAEAWDVNLHELGHAMSAAATRSSGGGGSHKIDQCYNRGVAWSEGWATFFAGAVRLSRDDADARFQHLVPRRAPIRIENVPADVCPGDTNEWRVAAGLWDLYDTHVDGRDRAATSFKRLWDALRDKPMTGFPDAWRYIQLALSPEERALGAEALRQNTLLQEAPVARRLAPSLAAPVWDGAR